MSIRAFTARWNEQHPLDVWWRKKNNILFGSPEHCAATFFAMRVEYEQHELDSEDKETTAAEEDSDFYQVTGQFIKPASAALLESLDNEDIYDSLDMSDLSQFDSPQTPAGVSIDD